MTLTGFYETVLSDTDSESNESFVSAREVQITFEITFQMYFSCNNKSYTVGVSGEI